MGGEHDGKAFVAGSTQRPCRTIGPAELTSFVLVHGSFHGPWCWSRFAPLLTAHGHRVVAPDLMASASPPDLGAYARIVAAAIDGVPDPVVLVGHSMGGLVACQAAEWRAERVGALVLVAALLLRSGETLVDFIEAHAELGVEDLVLKTMELNADGTEASFPAAVAPAIFYNCCTPADAARASAQLRPQATAVYRTPLAATPERLGRVPRHYVETRQDRAVSPLYQQQMVRRSPCRSVAVLDTDHSPFLSCPAALAEIVLRVAASAEAGPA
jgi:pimeloyl-ACP methyl ester carboxylesterase